jgi:hypothetical protein
MPLSFVKIPTVKVGQIYECTQKHHKGWVVEVVKVSSSHIEAKGVSGNQASRSKAHSKNGNYNYLRTQFERDYRLQRDVMSDTVLTEQPTVEHTPEPTSNGELPVIDSPAETRLCPGCYQFKPLDDFKHPKKGYFKECKACLGAKRVATMAARRADKLATQTGSVLTAEAVLTKYEQPEYPTLAQATATPMAANLATRLLEIATEVEHLSYPTALLYAVRDLLLEVTDAHGVCVVPQPTIDKLQQEFNLAKTNVEWKDE